jgi:hypothetical protein
MKGEQSQGRYCAVAKGRKIGVFDDWTEAKKQVDNFTGHDYMDFCDLKSAVAYLCEKGIPEDRVRLFRKAFKHLPTFTPDPTASFNEEFTRFASSQRMNGQQKRKAKIEAIRDEIIQHFLPEGVRISDEQEDENGYVVLDHHQKLEIFQALCRKARKPVHKSLDECLLELKNRPFVNIMDFVKTYRTGEEVCTFDDWDEFKEYTFNDRTVNLAMARENEFLAPLLQDLGRGPNAVDPRAAMRRIEANRAAKMPERGRERERNQEQVVTACKNEPTHVPDLSSRELSPSRLDPDVPSSRSPSPVPDLPRLDLKNMSGNDYHLQATSEPATATLRSSTIREATSTPLTDLSDSDFVGVKKECMEPPQDFDDPEFDDPEFQHVLLLKKRT